MSWFDKAYDAVAGALFATDTSAEDAIRHAAQKQAPVVWLVGKTGSGKTSIIAALTGHEQAEVGNGFAPCTRTARVFDHPEDAPLIRFLDTRGLEEPGYDPAEDIAWCEDQSHLILAVVRAVDPSQGTILSVLQEARARHPDWPVIIAQTGLHDLYPADVSHPDPYGFAGDSAAITRDESLRALRQALAHQRATFATLSGAAPKFVPIDFTRVVDGYAPPDYGLEALRNALVDAGLEVFQHQDRAKADAFARRCWVSILAYATLAAGGAAIPVPFVDLPTLATANGLMLRALATRYAVEWTYATFAQFIGAIGFGTLAWWGLRFGLVELVKLIPVAGWGAGAAINGTFAFGLTVGLGQAACVWLGSTRDGQPASTDAIRQAFADGLKRKPPNSPGGKPA